jgi:hypothetical protein
MKTVGRVGRLRARFSGAGSGSAQPRTTWWWAKRGLGIIVFLPILALISRYGGRDRGQLQRQRRTAVRWRWAYALGLPDALGLPEPSSSSGELCITSPPDNSTIAITDPTYVDGANTGPNDRAPALSTLKLKIAGTSTGCPGPVVVNGVSATAGSGDAWQAEIPIPTKLGPMTLTATAAGCDPASSTVTLINIVITSPAENAQEAITDAPAMPALNATLSVLGYSGDTSGVSFSWTLNIRGETVHRPGGPQNWDAYSQDAATGSTTGTGQPWKPSYDQIIGGVGRLTVTASLPGVLEPMVTSFPRWINIPGDNPQVGPVDDFVRKANPQWAGTINHIICHESSTQQFSPRASNNGQPPIPDVPADWKPNPGPGQPKYGPPAGIGIAQLDQEVGTLPLADYWNWQTDLQDGINLFLQEKLPTAQAWAGKEQQRLVNRLNAAIAKAKADRKAIGDTTPLPPIQVTTVPALTDQQISWLAIRLYKGYYQLHFDADYVLSSNGLNVNLVGTVQWVGMTPSTPGHWGHAPADLSLRQPWIPAGEPSYVDSVLGCGNS